MFYGKTDTTINVCKYMDRKGSSAMLTSFQSAGVAPQVNPRITEIRKLQGIHPASEIQGRRHQKSKTGTSVVPQKGLMFSKNLKITVTSETNINVCYCLFL